MAKYKTYNSSESVKAYKVTAAEGEDVITPQGTFHANKGDYVTDVPSVENADSFEGRFKAPAAKSKTPAKKTASKPSKTASKRS